MELEPSFEGWENLIEWDFISHAEKLRSASISSTLYSGSDLEALPSHTQGLDLNYYDLAVYPLPCYDITNDFSPEELSRCTSYTSTDQPNNVDYATPTSCDGQSDTAVAPIQRSKRKRASKGVSKKGPPDRTADERRYRTKLSDKMSELGNTIPTIRAAAQAQCGAETETPPGLEPARNDRKVTILHKAIEYIHYLEGRNETMTTELTRLRDRQNADILRILEQ